MSEFESAVGPPFGPQDLLRKVQEVACLGFLDWHVAADVMFWSDELCHLFGVDPKSVQPTLEAATALLHPDDHDRVVRHIQAALNGECDYDVFHRIVRPDGEVRHVHAQAEITRDADGYPVRMLGTVLDVTALKEAEEALAVEKAYFEELFEGAPEAVIVVDTENRLLRANRCFTELFGYTLEEALGRDMDEMLVPEECRQEGAAATAEVMGGGSVHLETVRRRKDGTTVSVSLLASPIRTESGQLAVYAIYRDIGERLRAQEIIARLAYYDDLTGLANRALVTDRLEQEVSRIRRSGRPSALLFVGIDGLHRINETLGHAAGDAVVIEVARRLQAAVRECDTVGRFTGDEFAVLVSQLDDVSRAQKVARSLLAALASPFDPASRAVESRSVGSQAVESPAVESPAVESPAVESPAVESHAVESPAVESGPAESHAVDILASVGVTLIPADGRRAEDLLRNAEAALQQAKAAGAGTYRLFTPELNEGVARMLALRAALFHALERGEFSLHYQPLIDLRSGEWIGAEALLRWQHPEFGQVPPLEFIPLAEETGLITEIGAWVLDTACQQAKEWRVVLGRRFEMAVNVSEPQFRNGGLVGVVDRALGASDLDSADLELEVTERLLMDDYPAIQTAISALLERGVRLALDDFGTGYSSLSYLRAYSFHRLKVDRSFVRDVATDPEDAALVRAMVHMGQALGLEVVAEGIETEEQFAFVRDSGCHLGQGYHFCRPLPPDELGEWLAEPGKA